VSEGDQSSIDLVRRTACQGLAETGSGIDQLVKILKRIIFFKIFEKSRNSINCLKSTQNQHFLKYLKKFEGKIFRFVRFLENSQHFCFENFESFFSFPKILPTQSLSE
jgi:hypothetical protein